MDEEVEDKHPKALKNNHSGEHKGQNLFGGLEETKAEVPRDNDKIVKAIQAKP